MSVQALKRRRADLVHLSAAEWKQFSGGMYRVSVLSFHTGLVSICRPRRNESFVLLSRRTESKKMYACGTFLTCTLHEPIYICAKELTYVFMNINVFIRWTQVNPIDKREIGSAGIHLHFINALLYTNFFFDRRRLISVSNTCFHPQFSGATKRSSEFLTWGRIVVKCWCHF